MRLPSWGKRGTANVSQANAQPPQMAQAAQTIDLTHLDDAGFDKLYRGEIEQPLIAREAERVADVSTFWGRLIPGCIGVIALAGLALAFLPSQFGFIGGFIALVAVSWFAYAP